MFRCCAPVENFPEQFRIYSSLLSVRDYTAAQASERRWWISAGECLPSACLSGKEVGFGVVLLSLFCCTKSLNDVFYACFNVS